VNAVTTRVAMFASRAAEWQAVRAFIAEFCGQSEADEQACARTLRLAEELFVQTVKQGHAGGSDAPVWIALEAQGGRVTLTYEDLAPPFNPFVAGRAETPETFEYAYLFGRNRIRVAFG